MAVFHNGLQKSNQNQRVGAKNPSETSQNYEERSKRLYFVYFTLMHVKVLIPAVIDTHKQITTTLK